MASRQTVSRGIQINGTTISVAIMLLGLAGTWGTLGWRMSQVENWQSRHEGLDTDIATIKATLDGMRDKLGSIDSAVGKIGDRISRSPQPGTASPQ